MSDVVHNIDKFQYGNIKGCSTSHYLIKLLDDVYKGIDTPNNLAVITLVDFRKAFDLVDHSVAIRELFALGCRYSILPVVIDFLTGRKHQVLYGESVSDYQEITCGVPQGTKLGPIIFLCLVNSIAQNLPTHVKFVDDLALAEIVKTSNCITFTMQRSLNTVSAECAEVLVIINPIKCEILIACPSKRPIVYPDFSINDVHLPYVTETKLLGVYLNSNLNWDTHIDFILKKVRKCIFILYRAKQFRFSTDTMFTMYAWFIRTSL